MAAGSANHYLVADTREAHVNGLLGAACRAAGETCQIAQLNTGDYLVCRQFAGGGAEVLAAFERKTLTDFAASIRDGRHENRHKLLDLRARTGAAVYYLVEGPAFPRPSARYGRLPYSTLLSAITNLMVRDGIQVVQTADQAHTAQRLVEFLRAYRGTAVPWTQAPPADSAPADGTPAEGAEGAEGGEAPPPSLTGSPAPCPKPTNSWPPGSGPDYGGSPPPWGPTWRPGSR
jgi:hypothetical protein